MKKYQQGFYFISLLFIQHITIAQPGQPDSTFNGNGIAFVSVPNSYMVPLTDILQKDGKLLIAGRGFKDQSKSNADGIILRLNTDGTNDNSFGSNGLVFTDFGNKIEDFFCVSVQQDGKIIAGGSSSNGDAGDPQKGVAARYYANGVPDSSFGENGKIITDYNPLPFSVETIYQMETLENGALLANAAVADTADANQVPLKAMYHSNGILDSTFGVNGILKDSGSIPATIDLSGRKIYFDDRSLDDLDHFAISRRLPDGTLDHSFNRTGTSFIFIDTLGVTPSTCIIQPDKKILIGGILNTKLCDRSNCNGRDFLLVRYRDNGSIDSSFGSDGMARLRFDLSNELQKILLQSDGKILVAGTVTNNPAGFEGAYGLARYLPNGQVDSGFGENGKKIYGSFNDDGRLSGMLIRNRRIYLCGRSNENITSSTGFLVYAIQNDYSHHTTTSLKLCPGTLQTSLTSDVTGVSYQWQQGNDGTNFTSITNSDQYAGTESPTLLLKNIALSWSGYQFRCITGTDTSSTIILRFVNAWTGAVSNNWEDTGNWSCGQLPNDQSDVVIYNSLVNVNADVSVKSLTLKLGAAISVSAGHSVLITGSSIQPPE